MYWPGMNSDLTDHISRCDICSSYQSNQAREPLISHEIVDRPWQKIGADFFTLDGTDYLCVVEYYSSYFEIDRLETKTAKGIAKILRKLFSVHGIPNQLISEKSYSVLKNSKSLRPATSLKSSQVHLAILRAMARLKMPSRQQNPS